MPSLNDEQIYKLLNDFWFEAHHQGVIPEHRKWSVAHLILLPPLTINRMRQDKLSHIISTFVRLGDQLVGDSEIILQTRN